MSPVQQADNATRDLNYLIEIKGELSPWYRIPYLRDLHNAIAEGERVLRLLSEI